MGGPFTTVNTTGGVLAGRECHWTNTHNNNILFPQLFIWWLFYVSEILGTCKEVRACVHSLGPARDELCEAGREGVTSH